MGSESKFRYGILGGQYPGLGVNWLEGLRFRNVLRDAERIHILEGKDSGAKVDKRLGKLKEQLMGLRGYSTGRMAALFSMVIIYNL